MGSDPPAIRRSHPDPLAPRALDRHHLLGSFVRRRTGGQAASLRPSSPPVSPSPTTSPHVGARPNVLVIVADDQRWDTLGAMPNTNRWIRDQGVWFPHAMVATPLCCPSRSSIFIGDYAHNTGVHDNGDAAWQVIPQAHTIQDELQGEGYQTGIVGKYFNTWPLENRPPFFDRWAIFTPGEEGGQGYFDTTWNVDGNIVHPSTYSTDFVANQGLRFLNALIDGTRRPGSCTSRRSHHTGRPRQRLPTRRLPCPPSIRTRRSSSAIDPTNRPGTSSRPTPFPKRSPFAKISSALSARSTPWLDESCAGSSNTKRLATR